MNHFMNLGTHATFIVAAYAVAVTVIAVLVGWVWLDHRAQKQKLAKLEAGGVTRRSERPAGKPA
jgi:heme exporter protein D